MSVIAGILLVGDPGRYPGTPGSDGSRRTVRRAGAGTARPAGQASVGRETASVCGVPGAASLLVWPPRST
ncbi:hypothetical protein D8I24_4362 [Cupriavidus necator H850]|nr:hypothetical protein D8I24_4362 [Cupriavidus necator H850]